MTCALEPCDLYRQLLATTKAEREADKARIAALEEALRPIYEGLETAKWRPLGADRVKRIYVTSTAVERVRAALENRHE